MSKREELQTILQNLIGVRSDGKANVYFQPPSTVKMNYPCIVYSRNRIDTRHANNELYKYSSGYVVTVIDPDPDSEILEKLLRLPYCRFDRHFTAENLNHDVYSIYY